MDLMRRRVMKQLAGTAALGSLGAGLPGRRVHAETGGPDPASGGRWYELDIIGDDYLDGQVLRFLEAVWHEMGDIGEILDTASRIRIGDPQNWYDEWFATAERVAAVARRAEEGGHPVSAGEAYLRASNYFRGAEWFDHETPAARLHAETFQRAVKLLGAPIEPVEIPYEETTLPGYFFRAAGAGEKRPLLVAHSGWDGTPEEMKFIGEGAVKRGYHCLIFSGPGQALVIREQKLPFRHDWEKVVSPVIDFCLEQPGVDADRIGLLGVSFGGYLATRAAAFEHRLKVCVANPGILNFYALHAAYQGPEAMALVDSDPEAYDAIAYRGMEKSPQARTRLQDSMLKFGGRTPAEASRNLRLYTNEGITDQIRCRMLIMDGADESINADQAKLLYDVLPGPKTYRFFDAASTGSLHCQTGALSVSNQAMFDWLDDNLKG